MYINPDFWNRIMRYILLNEVYPNFGRCLSAFLSDGVNGFSTEWKDGFRIWEHVCNNALDMTKLVMSLIYETGSTNGSIDTTKKLWKVLFRSAEKSGQLDLVVKLFVENIEMMETGSKFPDTDPQTLYVRYPSLYEPNDYITDEVKIEVSVRSLRTPYTTVSVQSLLNEINPNPAYGEVPFPVDVVEPRKTFLEKAFLLYEEFGKPDKSKIKTERMSRHLYDLGNIMHTQFGREALEDHNLYEYLIKHREWYSKISWVDYQSLKRTTISFIPPEDLLETFRQDYLTMQEQMIYGDALPFDDLIDKLKVLQDEFRKIKGDVT